MAETNFKAQNLVKVIGKVTDFDLAEKTYPDKQNPGEEYQAMTGSVTVEIDPTNTMKLRYFQREKFKSGKANRAFTMLKSWAEAPKDEETGLPTKGIGELIDVNTNFQANAFVINGEMIENSDVQGGFTDVLTSPLKPKSDFKVQAFIKDLPIEAEPKEGEEEDFEPFWRLKAFLFDYTGLMFPVNFVLKREAAADFFTDEVEGSEGNGIFIKIWGDVINSETITTTTEENAFGDELVVEHRNTRKENIITGASPEHPDLSDEDNKFIKEAVLAGRAKYETYLAGVQEKAENETPNAIGGGSESKKKEAGAKKEKTEAKKYEF